MKKIAIFSGFYLPFLGGIERYTSKLSAELVKLGYQIVIITTNHVGLPSYENSEFTIYRLPTHEVFKHRYPILKRNDEFRQLLSKIQDEQIDYVICNTRFQLTTPLGLKFAKRHNIPTLIIEHGSSHFSVGNKILDIFGKVYEHCLTSYIKLYVKDFYGVSERCNEWLKHYRIKARGVFYNSISADTYDTFKSETYKRDFSDKTVITYAGRIIPEKGVEMLIGAFCAISQKYQNLVLVVAGDGSLLPVLRDRHKDINIYFEGKLDYEDTMKLLNVTDIFCYPSMYPEGLPTAILEAGIMKSAVVATDRGGTKEVIISPEYGIIVDENQASLTEALENLLNNPSRLEQLKDNLYKRVKNNFTWEITASKVNKALREIDSE